MDDDNVDGDVDVDEDVDVDVNEVDVDVDGRLFRERRTDDLSIVGNVDDNGVDVSDDDAVDDADVGTEAEDDSWIACSMYKDLFPELEVHDEEDDDDDDDIFCFISTSTSSPSSSSPSSSLSVSRRCGNARVSAFASRINT